MWVVPCLLSHSQRSVHWRKSEAGVCGNPDLGSLPSLPTPSRTPPDSTREALERCWRQLDRWMSNRTFRLSDCRKNTYSFHNYLLSKVIISMLPLAGLAEGEMRRNSVCHTKTDAHGPPAQPPMRVHTHTVCSLLMQMLWKWW